MNTKSPKEIEDIKKRFKDLLKFRSEKEKIQHDAQMLMFRFLTETQKYQDIQGVNRKTLAQKVKTSASYLTQLFRGDKPLNFITPAKFQKALNITYTITASSNSAEISIQDENLWLEAIDKYNVSGGFWCYKKFNTPDRNVYEEGSDLLIDNELQYDYQAIPA